MGFNSAFKGLNAQRVIWIFRTERTRFIDFYWDLRVRISSFMSLVTGLYRSWLKCIKAILFLARLESGVETKHFTNSFQTGTDTVLPPGDSN